LSFYLKLINPVKMKKSLKVMLGFALFFTTLIGTSKAQNLPEISDSLYSNVLKEQRSIKIRLPEQYKQGSDQKFEVIYMIDGEWNMETYSFIFNFAKGENFVPPVILVAIPNTYINGANMRDRDFLPQKVADNQLAGGADNMIAFLKNELIPYINKKYPTNGDNSLFGHSYGGLFTMYVLLTEPQLFNTYYCSDPSFWWNNNFMNKLALKTFESTTELDKTLWINGIESTFKGMGIQTMDSILKVKAPKNLNWKTAAFPNETHNSVRLKGIYDGIKFAYSGYTKSSVIFHPMAGVLLKDKPVKIFLMTNSPNIHYTVDGTDPDISSPRAEGIFEITGPAKLAIKSFAHKKTYGTISKGNFEIGNIFPAISKLKNAKSGGLKYSYYEGKWDSLPDFKKLKPIKTGITDSTFNISKLQSPTNFAVVFEGFYKIETDGYYAFGLDSDDGSKFFLNNQLIVNQDGLHGMGNFKSYVVPLQKGFYPVRIEFFQREGGLDLQLLYLTPGTNNPIPVPYKLQYN
jgi:predicted alpha/beta superfamily hydrolase